MKLPTLILVFVLSVLSAIGQEAEPSVFVRVYPGRLDDVCWENQSAIWRAYGPALQESGEKAYGFDVWCKNTPKLVSEERYAKDSLGLVERHKLPGGAWGSPEAKRIENETSYHIDHGNGLDCYSVGPSLGGGTPALLVDGQIVFPWCYKEYKLLFSTPDSICFELIYNPAQIGDDTVVEHRRITVISGTRFCKCEVRFDGLTHPQQVCAGIVLHGNEDGIRLSQRQHYIAYEDPSDRPDDASVGKVMIGVYAPQMTQVLVSQSHLLAVAPYQPGDTFTYWFGSGWSLGDCPTVEQMVDELKQFETNSF